MSIARLTEENSITKNIKICSQCGKQLAKFYRVKSCRTCYDKKLWERKKLTMSQIKCKCSGECKDMIWPFDLSGRPSMFKQGHNSRHPDYRPPIPILKGENNPNWKGGKFEKRGYEYVPAPNHPHKTFQGYVYRHRLVMEEKLGRYLRPDEEIHHIDGNKKNNHPDNLQLVTKSEHTKIHHPKKDMSNRVCKLCKSSTTRIDSRGYHCWHKYNGGFICVKCYKKNNY